MNWIFILISAKRNHVFATKTVIREGTVIALCRDDCKVKFLQDPKPILAKLNLPKEPKAQTTK
jgi:hypothetical protein